MNDTDTSTEAQSLAALDFDPRLPCEHSKHGVNHDEGDAAAYVARATCPCGIDKNYLICHSGFVLVSSATLRCPVCGRTSPAAQLRIVQVLGTEAQR